MDTYFVFQYLSQLETAHPKFNRKEDLLWYLVFCSSVILVSSAPQMLSNVAGCPMAPPPLLHLLHLPG